MNTEPPTASTSAALPRLTDADLRKVADAHDVLPVTVLRALCGLPLRGRAVRERASRAAAQLRGMVAA